MERKKMWLKRVKLKGEEMCRARRETESFGNSKKLPKVAIYFPLIV